MKWARLKVDFVLLAQALSFPDDVMIERVFMDPRIGEPRHCELVIRGESLPVPETAEGGVIPEIDAIYEHDPDVMMTLPAYHITWRTKELT